MKSYELTYIISSGISSEEVDATIKNIESAILSKEGVILKSEKTTAQTLAYPIKKQSSGYFVAVTFQILEDKIKEIKDILEKSKEVLRHLIIINKPVKIMKERRTRKPSALQDSNTPESSSKGEDKKKKEKVEVEEMEKKLDEILS
jgi:small subunit ribosomal protein S6